MKMLYNVNMTLDVALKTDSENIQQLLDLIGGCVSSNISQHTTVGTVVEITPKITRVDIQNGE